MSYPTTIVKAALLHLRQQAGTAHESLGLLNQGQTLEVLELDDSGTWAKVKADDGRAGWCSLKYLMPTGAAPHSLWLEVAMREIGVREMPGPAENHPRIQEYLASVDDLKGIASSRDETAWCSCFMNWCVEQVGLDGTNTAWARSWTQWRNTVAYKDAKPGHIAVFRRTGLGVDGGHVGIFMGFAQGGEQVNVLGGNQGNAVRISRFPVEGMMGGMLYKLQSLRAA
ncbi:TIGR02594 family protein [Ideonella sp.]|uniref:TIGR02594 family protein n=1 Tax=Ideonella sp. TaxID=1929293 RepID=UPI0037C0E1C9